MGHDDIGFLGPVRGEPGKQLLRARVPVVVVEIVFVHEAGAHAGFGKPQPVLQTMIEGAAGHRLRMEGAQRRGGELHSGQDGNIVGAREIAAMIRGVASLRLAELRRC